MTPVVFAAIGLVLIFNAVADPLKYSLGTFCLAVAVTTLPLTLPAAWVYAEQERLPWWAIAGIVVGLWIGTIIGARGATMLSETTLKRMLPPLIFATAAFMAFRAL